LLPGSCDPEVDVFEQDVGNSVTVAPSTTVAVVWGCSMLLMSWLTVASTRLALSARSDRGCTCVVTALADQVRDQCS
jgi:hypothetical protein